MNLRSNPDSSLFLTDLNLDPPKIDTVPFSGQDKSEYRWDQRPFKDYARHIVAKRSQKGKECLLVMPGSTGRDIQLLRHYGVSVKKPIWQIVEKDVSQFRYLKENGILGKDRYQYCSDSFNRLPVRDSEGQYLIGKPFDFAWFDGFGNLNLSDVSWFRDQFTVTPELDLFFTFSFSARGFKSSLVNVLRSTLERWHPKLFQETILGIHPASQFKAHYDPRALTRSIAMDYNIAVHWLLFQYLFSNYTFEVSGWVYDDEDHQEMLLYHLKNFKFTEVSPEKIKTIGAIEQIIEILNSYRGNNSDQEIATELNLDSNKIYQWRQINELPIAADFKYYRLAQGLEILLNSEEIPETSNYGHLICQALESFHPLAKDRTECTYSKNKIIIKSPKAEYQIKIGSEIAFDPERSQEIEITPHFLHPNNHNALYSVFRILFRGDEYLHPQLCNYGYGDCFILSDPQKEAIFAWKSSYQLGEKAGLIVLPTGMGKTVVAAEIVNLLVELLKSGFRILFLSHRSEILRQAIEKFREHTGFTPEDYAKFYGNKEKPLNLLNKKLVFASIPTLNKTEYLKKIPQDQFDLVIIDEAHHANAPTWLKTINHFRDSAYLLGLTATPFRTSGEKPAEVFNENLLSRKSLNRGIWEGYLSWPNYHLYDDQTDYAAILKKDDTVSENIQSQKCFNPGYQKIVLEKFLLHAGDRKTIAFTSDIKSAKVMSDYFNKHGVASQYISYQHSKIKGDQELSEREQILSDFIAGKYQVLFSVSIFDEGVDVPDVGAILKLNNTESPLKIVQQLGRGLRLFPNKKDVIIIDFIGNYVTLESIFNLGGISGIGKRNVMRIKTEKNSAHRVEVQDDEDLPVFPETACQIEPSVKMILKNLIEETAPEKITPLIQTKIKKMCQEGYLSFDIAALYNIASETVDKLCSNVTPLIDTKLVYRIRENIQIKKIANSTNNQAVVVKLLKPYAPGGWKEIQGRITELDDLKNHIKNFSKQGLSIEKISSILKLTSDEIEEILE